MMIDQFETDALMDLAAKPPIVFVEGRGSWLIDHRGKRYLDFVQGWAVNSLGHSAPEIAQALAKQGSRLVNPSPTFYNDVAIALSKRLAHLAGMARVFFASSGAEANEGAIKLARKWGAIYRAGAYEIVTFDGAFHGRTLATMAASGKAGWDRLFEPKVPGFPKARFEDLESVTACINERTVAIMLEPVQGEAGVVPVSDAFLKALRALCDKRGLLLILDEVQTGVGRTGHMFAWQRTGVVPDIMTLGKGIGGGVPLAALMAQERVSVFAPGDQGGTYCGNPLMAAVGLAVVDVVARPEFLAGVRNLGELLSTRLKDLAAKHRLAGERGHGLLRALDLGAPRAPAVVEAARDLVPDGLLLNAPRPNLLRFMPALNVEATEIEVMIERLDDLLSSVRASSAESRH